MCGFPEACCNAQCLTGILHDQYVLNTENYITPRRNKVEGTGCLFLVLTLVLCYVEVSELIYVAFFVGSNHPQPIPDAVLPQVFLRKVLQVPLGHRDFRRDHDFELLPGHIHRIAEHAYANKVQGPTSEQFQKINVRKSSGLHGNLSHRYTFYILVDCTPRPFRSVPLARRTRRFPFRSKPWCPLRHGRGSSGRAVHPRFLSLPSARSSASLVRPSLRSILSFFGSSCPATPRIDGSCFASSSTHLLYLPL
mmetsp:Transcript_11567/g.71170  ORF Transcript_11567/g.71170 Transcript_11567/m.71170 type:complete len:251 (+) Transcript_11567:1029-1781(+)